MNPVTAAATVDASVGGTVTSVVTAVASLTAVVAKTGKSAADVELILRASDEESQPHFPIKPPPIRARAAREVSDVSDHIHNGRLLSLLNPASSRLHD